MKKRLTKASEGQMLYAVDLIRKAYKKGDVISHLCSRYKISKSNANVIYSETMKYIEQAIINKVQQYKAVLIDRLESQYSDTFAIEDVAKRLQRQRELIDTMAKISGVLNTSAPHANIFEHYPDDEKVIEVKPLETNDNKDEG